MSFTHLQVQSCYSLMKSTVKIEELILKVKKLGMSQVALTDHNVLHGAVEFYKMAIKHGIKPIIGLKIDIQSMYNPNHIITITLIAKNIKGYQELIQLSTDYQLSHEGITKRRLASLSQNVVTILPTDDKEIKSLINKNNLTELKALMSLFSDCYLGIHPNQTEIEVNRLSDLNLPLIAVGDVRCLEEQDSFSLDILEHIDANESLEMDTKARINYSLRSSEEMISFYEHNHVSTAVENANKVADSTEWKLELGETALPRFKVPDNHSTDSYLKELCFEGLKEFNPNHSHEYVARLEKELSVISEMGFSDYFLIVWDVMKFAHENNIETGFGRGSAAASLVAFTLKITGVDPLEYDLLFERFLNKERFTMPDIDLDFPDNKRHLILQYVLEQYGSEHVAQILTFGTFGAKSSIREILRVMDTPVDEMKRWSAAIPNQPKITLDQSFKESKALQKLINENNKNQRIFEMAKIIEGLPRNYSTHAAGVVMSKEPLTNSVPLQEGITEIHNTQLTMGDVESVGLLKMDFLSLKNLTVLANCFRYSRFEKKQVLNKEDIPMNNIHTIQLFAKGDTNGVFQFESEGIKKVLRKMQPTSIEDIIATNALYRPGPMQQIETYINRKHEKESITYPHDDLKSILELTYGIIVYQEQVMQVATTLAGYTLSEADQLRRTMSKKIQSEMDEGREKFIQGALSKGYDQEVAISVYNYIDHFANYGFNRAHAVVYSMLAYYLGYFKANYPMSFFASVLISDWTSKEKIKVYESEIRKRKIKLQSPDINSSLKSFTISQNGIQFGLKSIKGLSDGFISHILSVRKQSGRFDSLIDFCESIESQYLQKNQIEPLIKSGAFDSIGYNRKSMLLSLESIIESVEKSGGNISLFEVTKPRMTKVEEYLPEELVQLEQEVTGFYFSGHPLNKYDGLKDMYKVEAIADVPFEKNQTIMGKIIGIRKIQTKNNQPMAFVTLMDETDELSLVIFPNKYSKYLKILKKDSVLIAKGKVELKNSQKQMLIDELIDADSVIKKVKTLFLKFTNLEKQGHEFSYVQNILKNEPGNIKVVIFDESTNKVSQLRNEYNYNNDPRVLNKLIQVLGKGNCVLK